MDSTQARDDLEAIAVARRHASELRAYRQSGSILVAWGLVWLAGFGAQEFSPSNASTVWLLGWLGALGWTFTRPRQDGQGRVSASWLLAVSFAFSLIVISEADMRQAAMICGLLLSASASLLGIWVGKRFHVLAILVFAAAALGWWVFPAWLYLLLALGGGGGLALAGAWLQRP